MSESMTLAELSEASGVPARTIRFYIARRVLDGPVKAGRGAVYDSTHLKRLQKIQQWQSEGRTIAEIARTIDGPPASGPLPVAWWQHLIADDVMVFVRDGSSPWRTKQVRAAIEELTARLKTEEGKRRDDE
jgi:DNA-binding transcriptional MerR regulator